MPVAIGCGQLVPYKHPFINCCTSTRALIASWNHHWRWSKIALSINTLGRHFCILKVIVRSSSGCSGTFWRTPEDGDTIRYKGWGLHPSNIYWFGWVLTCDSAHLKWVYSATTLREQIAGTMTQSNIPLSHIILIPELASSWPLLLLANCRLVSDKYQCCYKYKFVSHWIDSARFRTPDLPHGKPTFLA